MKNVIVFVALVLATQIAKAQVTLYIKITNSKIVLERSSTSEKKTSDKSIKSLIIDDMMIENIDGAVMRGVTDHAYIFAINQDVEILIVDADNAEVTFNMTGREGFSRIEVRTDSSKVEGEKLMTDALIMICKDSYVGVEEIKGKELFISVSTNSEARVRRMISEKAIVSVDRSELYCFVLETKSFNLTSKNALVSIELGKIKEAQIQSFEQNTIKIPQFKNIHLSLSKETIIEMKDD